MLQSLEAITAKQRKAATKYGSAAKKTITSTEATDPIDPFRQNSLEMGGGMKHDTRLGAGALSISSCISKNTGSNSAIAREKLAQLQQMQYQQQMLLIKQSIFDRNRPWNCEYCQPKTAPERTVDKKLLTFSRKCVANMVSRFMIKEEFYESRKVVELLNTNSRSVLVAQFKDYLIFDDIYEFLTAYYNLATSLDILTRHAVFYDSLGSLEVLCQYREDQIRDRHLVLHGLKPCYVGLEKQVQAILCQNFRQKLRIVLNKVKKVQIARGIQIDQTSYNETGSSQLSTPNKPETEQSKDNENKTANNRKVPRNSEQKSSRRLKRNFKKLIHSSMVRDYNFSRSHSGLMVAKDVFRPSSRDEQLITSIGNAVHKFDTQSSINFTNITVGDEVELLKGSVFDDESIARHIERPPEAEAFENIESMYMNAQLILDDLSSRPLTRQSIPKTNVATPASRIALYELHKLAQEETSRPRMPNIGQNGKHPLGRNKSLAGESNLDEGCSEDGNLKNDETIPGCQPNFYRRKASGNIDFSSRERDQIPIGQEEIMIVNEDCLQEGPQKSIPGSRMAATCSQGYLLPHSSSKKESGSKGVSATKANRRDKPEIEVAHIDRKSISFEKPTIISVAQPNGGGKAHQIAANMGSEGTNEHMPHLLQSSPQCHSIHSIDSNELQPHTTIANEEDKMNSTSEVNELNLLATGTSAQNSSSNFHADVPVSQMMKSSERMGEGRTLQSKVSHIVAPQLAASSSITSRKSQIVTHAISQLKVFDEGNKRSLQDQPLNGRFTSGTISGSSQKKQLNSQTNRMSTEKQVTATSVATTHVAKQKSKKSSTNGRGEQTPTSTAEMRNSGTTANGKIASNALSHVNSSSKKQLRGRGTPHSKNTVVTQAAKASPAGKGFTHFTLAQHKQMATSTRALPRQNMPPGSKVSFANKKGSMPLASTSSFGANFASNSQAMDERIMDMSARQYQHQTQHQVSGIKDHQIDKAQASLHQHDAEKIKVSKKLIASIKSNIQASNPNQASTVSSMQGQNLRRQPSNADGKLEKMTSPTHISTLSRQLAKGMPTTKTVSHLTTKVLAVGKTMKGQNQKRLEARTNSNGVKEVTACPKRKNQASLQGNLHTAFSSERLSNSNNLLSSKDQKRMVATKNTLTLKERVILEAAKKEGQNYASLPHGNSQSLQQVVKRTVSQGNQFLSGSTAQNANTLTLESVQPSQKVQLMRSQQLGGSMGPSTFANSKSIAAQKVDLYSIAGKLKLLNQPIQKTAAVVGNPNGVSQMPVSSTSVPRSLQQQRVTSSTNRKNSMKLNSRKVSVEQHCDSAKEILMHLKQRGKNQSSSRKAATTLQNQINSSQRYFSADSGVQQVVEAPTHPQKLHKSKEKQLKYVSGVAQTTTTAPALPVSSASKGKLVQSNNTASSGFAGHTADMSQYYTQRSNHRSGAAAANSNVVGSSPANIFMTPQVSSRNNPKLNEAQSQPTFTKMMAGLDPNIASRNNQLQNRNQMNELHMMTHTLNELQKHQTQQQRVSGVPSKGTANTSSKMTTVQNSTKKKKIAKLNRAGGAVRSGQILSPVSHQEAQMHIKSGQLLSPGSGLGKTRNTFASVTGSGSLTVTQAQPARLAAFQQHISASNPITGAQPSGSASQKHSQKNSGPSHNLLGRTGSNQTSSYAQHQNDNLLAAAVNFEQAATHASLPIHHQHHHSSRNAGIPLISHSSTTNMGHKVQHMTVTTMPVSSASLSAAHQLMTSTTHAKHVPIQHHALQSQSLKQELKLHSRKNSAVYSKALSQSQKTMMASQGQTQMTQPNQNNEHIVQSAGKNGHGHVNKKQHAQSRAQPFSL